MGKNDGTKGTIFDKGSWQAALNQSAKLFDKAGDDKKKAGTLLWQGAMSAIADWADDNKDDKGAETLYNEILGIMGEHRKGDVSKIKTVALAVEEKGLNLGDFPNLSRAYAEARRLIVTAREEKREDEIADEVIEAIAEAAPKTATTADSAAKLLLSKGIDGAVVAILDALNGVSGESNQAAHRAFLRAVSTEISARLQAVKDEAEKARKAEAEKARKERAEAKAKADAEKAAATKAEKEKAKNAKAEAAKEKAAKMLAEKKEREAAKATKAKKGSKAKVKDEEPEDVEDVEDETGDDLDEAEPTKAEKASATLKEMAEEKGVEPVKASIRRRPVRR